MAVELAADVSRLRKGLDQGIALINKFSQRATKNVQTFGTGFQQTAKQVQTGAKFMGSSYDKFALGTQKASAKVSKAVEAQTEKVKGAAKGVKEMGGAMGKAKPKMDEFTGGILNISKHLGKWISFNLTWFATWRLMWTALRAIKAGVAAIVEFDTAITNLGAVTGATQAQLLMLSDTSREVGATTRFTAVEVAKAMVDYSKAGFSVSEVNQMISGTALLAIGTLSDLTQTTQLMATTLRTFHLQASEAAVVANVFAAAITNSRLTIDSLRNSMKYIGPIMAEIGYTLEDTAAVLGVLADRGLEAGISARGLRGFFSALIAPSDKLRRELERVGLSVADVSPLANDLAVILRRLEEANFDVESAMRGLERRVGTTAVALVSAGKYFEVLREAITATTAAEVIAERQIGSLGYRLILLRSQATEVALDFRDIFLPSIQAVLSGVSSLLVAINELTSRVVEVLNILPPWARQLTIIAGLFLTISGAVGMFSGKVAVTAGTIGILTGGMAIMAKGMLSIISKIGIWGLAIAGITAGITILISKIKAAREETTRHRKEIAASVFDLGKQRTELARLAIMLGEYRDDENKLRTALEGVAGVYPEIRRLLMAETVTYEAAIVVVNELLEAKTKEAKVRRVDLIEAIRAEIEVHKGEIESLESLQERIKRTWPILRIFLYIWMLIKHGTLDAGKALAELDKKIKDLEGSLRAMEPPTKKAAKAVIEYKGPLELTAMDTLDLAKKTGVMGRELIKAYDAAIRELRIFRDAEATALRESITALQTREQRQIKFNEAIEDPEVEKAYKAWVKSEKDLTSLIEERADVLKKMRTTLDDLRDAEEKLTDLRAKRAISEEDFLETSLYLLSGRLEVLRKTAEKEEKWTKETGKLYIDTQREMYGAFEKLLDRRLKMALAEGKKEGQAIAELQAVWNRWTPYFEATASSYYELMSGLRALDEDWLEGMKRTHADFMGKYEKVVIRGMKPWWEEELRKIANVYKEYRGVMLEFERKMGRATIEEQIVWMRKMLADAEYWANKEYEAKLAFEEKLVGLYRERNKEIIAEAKKLAKTDLALALETLDNRLTAIEKEAAQYPILEKEIFDARQAILKDASEMAKKIHQEYVKVTADTIDEVLALTTHETDEKIKLFENLLKNEKLSLEEREHFEEALRELREIRDREEFEARLKIHEKFMEEYTAINETGLEELEIRDREAHFKALKAEDERYKKATKRLIEASRENVLVAQRFDQLRERLRQIHIHNLGMIDAEWAVWVAAINADVTGAYEKAAFEREYLTGESLRKQLIKWYNAGADEEKILRYLTLVQAMEFTKMEKRVEEWRNARILAEREIAEEIFKAELELTEAMNKLIWINYDTSVDSLRKTVLAWLSAGVDRQKIEAYLTLFQNIQNRKQFEQFKKWSEDIAARKREEVEEREAAEREVDIETLRAQEETTEVEREELKKRIVAWLNAGVEIEKIIRYLHELEKKEARDLTGLLNRTLDLLYVRIVRWFQDIGKGWTNLGILIGSAVKTGVDAAVDALASLFMYWWRGGDEATRYTRDQAQKRLDTIRRELEEEKRLHGEFTDRYKELMNEQARAQKELAEAEYALLQERQQWFRNFVDAIISEIMRLIAQMIALAALKAVLFLIGLEGGGSVSTATAGGEVASAMKKGGLVAKLQRRLQNLQKGGEVLIKAHEGEYVIPEPIVERIRKTREVPEELVEGIVAGKPPSFQRGGEIREGEFAPATWNIYFQPGAQFTELEKAQTRSWFERNILPLVREAERREQVPRW